jgi:hypothetical protein
MADKAAGGIASKVVTRKPVRVGTQNRGLDERAVSQIGQALGSHITSRRKELTGVAKPLNINAPAIASKLGNEIAAATKCGVGGSRTIMRSGAQGTHGAVDRGGPRIANTQGGWPDSK